MAVTMRAVICRQHGPAQALEPGVTDVPPTGPGQARIRVSACGINFPDLLLVEGKYQDKPALPFIPGGEVAGFIDQLSAGADHLRIGQPVMATTFLGGLAEYVVARARDIDELPPGMSMQMAAAFPGVYGTSYHALAQRARLLSGETLLVLGAAGGTGIAAVQIGKAMGARVLAAAGSDDKLAFLGANGADAVINYRTTNLRDAVRQLTGGRGADVIFDPVGGELFDLATRCINWNGRLLVVGFASGTIPRFPVNRVLQPVSRQATGRGCRQHGGTARTVHGRQAGAADLPRVYTGTNSGRARLPRKPHSDGQGRGFPERLNGSVYS